MSLKYQKNVDGIFTCIHCPYTAKNQSTMHYHLKKHEGALPHACKHCNQKFLQKSLLDLHTTARHPNACNHCNHKEFEQKSQ
jgi:transcription elongation factor Elf1